ncbi:hypothetical protein ACFWM1_25030 [Nocardia sp. NPDC058379]
MSQSMAIATTAALTKKLSTLCAVTRDPPGGEIVGGRVGQLPAQQ